MRLDEHWGVGADATNKTYERKVVAAVVAERNSQCVAPADRIFCYIAPTDAPREGDGRHVAERVGVFLYLDTLGMSKADDALGCPDFHVAR